MFQGPFQTGTASGTNVLTVCLDKLSASPQAIDAVAPSSFSFSTVAKELESLIHCRMSKLLWDDCISGMEPRSVVDVHLAHDCTIVGRSFLRWRVPLEKDSLVTVARTKGEAGITERGLQMSISPDGGCEGPLGSR
jgi:hypothetical protein